MKIKLDENLPLRLAEALRALGHDVDTVYDEGIEGGDDQALWGAACHAGRFLITQDLDFSDIRQFRPGTHPGLLLIRLRDPSRQALLSRVETLFRCEIVADWAGCFVIATERKLRVRRLA